MSKYLLLDVGGTNIQSRIIDKKEKKILFEKDYKTKDFISSIKLIERIVEDSKISKIKSGIFAIAGAYNPDQISMTNFDLIFNKKDIIEETILEDVILLNDFQALGYAVVYDDNLKLITIKEGKEEGFSKTVLGAGTGFGLCNIQNFKQTIVLPTEMGHTLFPSFIVINLRLSS
jgi:glucokinase